MSADAPDPSPVVFLRTISDPLRWRIMRELGHSDRRVHELTALVDKPQNLVSYHLRALRTAGLVSKRRSDADGRDSYYSVDLARCGRMLCSTGTALQPGLRLGVLPPGSHRVVVGRAPRVLFLCTGNSARSQIAQALVQEMSGHTVEAHSAGSHPKPLHPVAVEVMAARGIDISNRSTTHLRRFARTHFDQVVTLCDRVREVCPEFPSHPTLVHWSIADPARVADSPAAVHAAFERTADELEARIGYLLPLLAAPDPKETPTHV